MRHLLLSLLLALALVGCGEEATPTPGMSPPSTPFATAAPPPTVAATIPAEPPPEAPGAAVPGATLSSASGATQAAVVGAYCLAGLCETYDALGLPVPAEPLAVAPGEALAFALAHGAPQFVTLRVLAWQPVEDAPGIPASALDAPLLASGDLEPSATPPWEAPPLPGDYVLDMTTVYANGDSIAYAWRIVVGP